MKYVMRVAILAIVLALAIGRAASAQSAPPKDAPQRPPQALFGGGPPGALDQSLTFDARVGAGYDGNVAATPGSATGSDGSLAGLTAPGSQMTNATVSLGYVLSRSTFDLSASLGGWANYYKALSRPLIDGGSGRLGFTWTMTARSTLTFSESVSDQPLYVIFPVQAAPDQLDLPVQSAPISSTNALLQPEFVSQTNLGFSQKLTSRLSAYATGNFFQTRAVSQVPALTTASGSGGLTFALTKGLSLQAGYGESQARYVVNGVERWVSSNNVTAGINFSRALSLTRKTHLSFGAGTTALRDAANRTVRLDGNVLLTRDIGRSWEATLGYTRDVGYVQVFAAPLLSDSVGVGLGGQVSRRVGVQFDAGVRRGQVGLVSTGSGFTSTYGTASTSVALSSRLALTFDYSYLKYDLGESVVLPTGLARRINRQSVRATLDLLVPILRVMRKPDVAR